MDVQRFDPVAQGRGFTQVREATQPKALRGGVTLTGSYGLHPLELYAKGEGRTGGIVDHLVGVDLGGWVAPLDWLLVAVELPVLSATLLPSERGMPEALGFSGGELGIGDLRLSATFQLTRQADDGPVVSLGLAARVVLPTGRRDQFMSTGAVPFGVDLVIGRDFGPVRMSGYVGFEVHVASERMLNMRPDHELRWGLGAAVPLWDDQLELQLEWVGGTVLSAGVYDGVDSGGLGAEVGQLENTPMELHAAALIAPADWPVWLKAGLGPGLGPGFGTPELRAFLQLGLDLPREAPDAIDTDGDGLVDDVDRCVEGPEDFDGWEDEDGCPEPTEVLVEVVDEQGRERPDLVWKLDVGQGVSGDSVMLEPGRYEALAGATREDVEVPGGRLHRVTLVVPRSRGRLRVRIEDPSGAEVPGATWSASGDEGGVGERAPGEGVDVLPGDYQLRAQAPGYRPASKPVTVVVDREETLVLTLEPAKVAMTIERIDLRESVYFHTSKATIKPESFGLLDEVAELLVDHPELTLVRIEGHTDSRGSARSNKRLSQRRAESVRRYLITRGVAPERLEAVGYGEERPLMKGRGKAVWEKNRRVDFFVKERAQ